MTALAPYLLRMEIRLLTEQDVKAWWDLRLIALKDEPHSFAESAEEHEKRSLEQTGDFFRALNAEDFIIGAFENSELAGMAGFYREKHTKFRHKGTIWGVYVRRESRSKGIARAILSEVIRRARMIEGLEQILLVVAARRRSRAGYTNRLDSGNMVLSRARSKLVVNTSMTS